MDDSLKEHRKHLVSAEQKAQEDYDKTLVSLSGGALGISFIFLKDIVGLVNVNQKYLLFISWLCWGISIMLVLFSFFTSILALRKAIAQCDSQEEEPIKELAGGVFAKVTNVLNISGGILFFVGILLIAIFFSSNLENINGTKKPPEPATATSSTVTSPTPESSNSN